MLKKWSLHLGHTKNKLGNNIKFSVAICTRNRFEFIQKLLVDLKKQTIVPYEYFFVENIKEQQSLSYEKIFKVLKHPKIKYLTTVGNKAVALNICLKRAKCNPIIFLDDDIHIKKDTFEKIINAFETIPEATAFSIKTLHVRSDIYSRFNDYWYNSGCFNSLKPLTKSIAPTTVYCINLEKIKKHKIAFNENYNFSDDLDFFCQLKKHNLFLYYLPHIVSYHFFGNRSSSLSQYLKRYYQFGFDSYTISVEYPKVLYNAWLLPSRKLHYIFWPLFFISKVVKQTRDFIRNNEGFPVDLCVFSFFVFLAFDVGIYRSYFFLNRKK